MNRKLISTLALGAALVGGALSGPALAHHSVSAQFDYDKPFDFKATLQKIEWINPHSYLNFVSMEGGAPVAWTIESHGVAGLRNQGLTKDNLKVGDVYEIRGFRARNGSNNGFLKEIVFPNGKLFRMTSSDPNEK